MGVEPKEEDIPKDPSTFSLEAQQALVLMNALPDKLGWYEWRLVRERLWGSWRYFRYMM